MSNLWSDYAISMSRCAMLLLYPIDSFDYLLQRVHQGLQLRMSMANFSKAIFVAFIAKIKAHQDYPGLVGNIYSPFQGFSCGVTKCHLQPPA